MIRKGLYILIVDMPETRLKIGALGIVEIKEGSYCYAGSAMNGLDQRISRHLSKKKKVRWHIDHLTIESNGIEAYETICEGIEECDLCAIIQKNGGSGTIKGFGCSDCKCPTHLFYLPEGAKEKLLSCQLFIPYCQQSADRR